MSNHDPDLQRNAEATRQLGELVERLDAADLDRSLGGGWTVAFALVHLAFWDARQAVALGGYTGSQALPPEDELVNPALEAVAAMFDPAAAGPAAVEAAEAVDAAATALAAGGGTGVRLPPLAPPRGAHRPDRGGPRLTPLHLAMGWLPAALPPRYCGRAAFSMWPWRPRYSRTASSAAMPSPVADPSCFVDPARTSPAT